MAWNASVFFNSSLQLVAVGINSKFNRNYSAVERYITGITLCPLSVRCLSSALTARTAPRVWRAGPFQWSRAWSGGR